MFIAVSAKEPLNWPFESKDTTPFNGILDSLVILHDYRVLEFTQ